MFLHRDAAGGSPQLLPDNSRSFRFSLNPEDNRRDTQTTEDGTDPGPGRAGLWVRLGLVVVAVVTILGLSLLATGLLQPAPTVRDDPQSVITVWWDSALDSNPPDSTWKTVMCDGAEQQAADVITAEHTRQDTKWPPAEFYVRSGASPRVLATTTHGDHSTVTMRSFTSFFPATQDGFTSNGAEDLEWTVTLTHARHGTLRGKRWCIDHLTRRELPNVTYYAGDLVNGFQIPGNGTPSPSDTGFYSLDPGWSILTTPGQPSTPPSTPPAPTVRGSSGPTPLPGAPGGTPAPGLDGGANGQADTSSP